MEPNLKIDIIDVIYCDRNTVSDVDWPNRFGF